MVVAFLPSPESRRYSKALSAEEDAPEFIHLSTIYYITCLLTRSKMSLPAFTENTRLQA